MKVTDSVGLLGCTKTKTVGPDVCQSFCAVFFIRIDADINKFLINRLEMICLAQKIVGVSTFGSQNR